MPDWELSKSEEQVPLLRTMRSHNVKTQESQPRCFASTGIDHPGGYFQAAQWTPDGTSVVAYSKDHALRTFIVPPDLLEAHNKPLELRPYSTCTFPGPCVSWAIHPAFSLEDYSSCVAVSSHNDLPIRLTNLLSADRIDEDEEVPTLSHAKPVVASWPLIDPLTEKFLAASALIFPETATRAPGSVFLAGASNLLAIFDTERPGTGPICKVKTVPSLKRKFKSGGVGIKGIISALACSDASTGEGLVAAGTWSRDIGLYAADASLSQNAVWSLNTKPALSPTVDFDSQTGERIDIGGSGIDKVKWSPCGRYLYIFERCSDGGLIYDIRVTGKKLATLTGRDALSNQRLGVDIVQRQLSDSFCEILTPDSFANESDSTVSTASHDVFTGSVSGSLSVYRSPYLGSGAISPDITFKNFHEDAIGGLSMHPTYEVLAAASGQRRGRRNSSSEDTPKAESRSRLRNGEKGPSKSPDNSLKLWSR